MRRLSLFSGGDFTNKQPVSYLQTDSRWANTDYSAAGEATTIGKSGCGPSCAAMLIETLTSKTFTPANACAWALSHGYKAVNQGTYYSYFVPQFKVYGIACEQLNSANIYGGANGAETIHTKAFGLLKQGYYLIACMGKGTWTSSGHFVVVWWEDGKVRINDPASTKTERLSGDLNAFKSQVKYYWAIDARSHNNTTQEGGTVTVTLPVVKSGSKGDYVKTMQILLNGLGYACGDADGSCGPKTVAALKAFQKASSLTVDGSCGQATWTKLLGG